ncbi:hypothetical protein ADL01_01220 [Streptomyces sp. NRRL WC-3618]|uniref:hypothetical protein n=1 Tax=Streptomyces sp. NRRL WC-3618 TaxID=1519490 RepID=UPI0006C6DAB1|nr:hypothetical protein [Streptomyces sp. NRRL WC-3618]KOV88555.1 hypothetical protein ADL01_01220 [Streptomyces sp. NRRL WC-3618]
MPGVSACEAWGTRHQEVIIAPEPGGKKYDTKRARLRKEAEQSGVSGQDANEAANDSLQQDPKWQSQGPRTERGRGPKGERPENAD